MAATVAVLADRVLRRLNVAAVAPWNRPAAGRTVDYFNLATLALQLLGVVASDETPTPSDMEFARRRVVAVHDGLVEAGLVPWGSDDKVPMAVSQDYAALAAIRCASAFGKAADPAGIPILEDRIKRVVMQMKAQGDAEQAVVDVHASLEARGQARWTLHDIPDFAEGPYVVLAANRLAPQFGLRLDELGEVRALRELAQVVALPTRGDPVRADYF